MNEIDDFRANLRELADSAPAPRSDAAGLAARGRRTVRRRRLVAVAGPVAAATAAVALVATTATGGAGGAGGSAAGVPDRPGPVASDGSTLDGRRVLLAAANKAETQPTAAFWHARTTNSRLTPVAAGSGAYWVVDGSETFLIAPATAVGPVTMHSRTLGGSPLTRADRTAWERAGSPKDYFYRPEARGGSIAPGTAGAWEKQNYQAEPGRFPVSGHAFPKDATLDQVRALPADQARLADIFFGGADPADTRDRWDRHQPDVRLKQIALRLEQTPFTPHTVAGIMRMLSAQPGVQTTAGLTLPSGRRAIALSATQAAVFPLEDKTDAGGCGGKPCKVTWTTRDHLERFQLLFDQESGRYLGTRSIMAKPGGDYRAIRPGTVLSQDFVQVDWSATRPTPPSQIPDLSTSS